jgi:hypothetical protein
LSLPPTFPGPMLFDITVSHQRCLSNKTIEI